MNDGEFHRIAADTLLHIEQAVEHSGADIDFEITDSILTLDFANGTQIVINKQGTAKQIWVAARAGGFHYRYDAGAKRWINDQNGTELMAELSRLVSQQAGKSVHLG
jgi:CyaY protein